MHFLLYSALVSAVSFIVGYHARVWIDERREGKEQPMPAVSAAVARMVNQHETYCMPWETYVHKCFASTNGGPQKRYVVTIQEDS